MEVEVNLKSRETGKSRRLIIDEKSDPLKT
jgi:hypothetical protein